MTQIVLQFPKPQTVPVWPSMLFSPLYSAQAAAEELLSMPACTAVRTGVPADGGRTPCHGSAPTGWGRAGGCAGRRGCGPGKKKQNAPPINFRAAGLFNWLEVKVSALSGSFGHFCGPFLGAALHLIGSDVLDMLRKAPLMAEGIGQLAVAIAPKLVVEWHVHLGARSDSPVEGRDPIFQVQEEAARGLRYLRRGAGQA